MWDICFLCSMAGDCLEIRDLAVNGLGLGFFVFPISANIADSSEISKKRGDEIFQKVYWYYKEGYNVVNYFV